MSSIHARTLRRNPLHGILGALELCRARETPPTVVAELLASINDGVDLMCTITNDLLDLEKLRCGKFVIRATPVPLRSLIENVANAARPACKGAFSVFVDSAVPSSILADGLRLRQVV
jgi:two-component system CheB/CheR fusion protein